MADWFETRFREAVDTGPLDPAVVARMRALVVEEWQRDAETIPSADERMTPPESMARMQRLATSVASGQRLRTHRWRLVAVAAAVVMIVLGAGIAITDRGSDDARLSTDATATPLPLGREEIRVTPDLIEFGDGLVGFSNDPSDVAPFRSRSIARIDGRTYVSAGRYQTEEDRLAEPSEGVLAAFDGAGRELWRTAMDHPTRSIEVLNGDVWVKSGGGVTRIDGSDGTVLGEAPIVGFVQDIVAAFGSLWAVTESGLIRIDPDLSTTAVELRRTGHEPFLTEVEAGAGAIWVPLWLDGVAMIDPRTLEVTMVSGDEIGHEAVQVSVDGDVAYVAGSQAVTSIIDGRVQATSVSDRQVQYLGQVDGVAGVTLQGGQFMTLQANHPVVAEQRQISSEAIAMEVDGQAWAETGANHSFRRVHLLAVPEEDS